MAIIAISGKMASGKDALTSLIRKNNYTFNKVAFADKLKHIVAVMCDMPIESQYSEAGKNTFIPEFNMTCGELQQTIGTDVLRSWDKNVHIAMTKRRLEPSKNYILSDVRFENEGNSAMDMGAFMVRINVGEQAKKDRVKYVRDPNHPSETGMNNWTSWDYIYNNDGTLKDLEKVALDILDKVGEKPNWVLKKISNMLFWLETRVGRKIIEL
jgi:hypothetical protein